MCPGDVSSQIQWQYGYNSQISPLSKYYDILFQSGASERRAGCELEVRTLAASICQQESKKESSTHFRAMRAKNNPSIKNLPVYLHICWWEERGQHVHSDLHKQHEPTSQLQVLSLITSSYIKLSDYSSNSTTRLWCLTSQPQQQTTSCHSKPGTNHLIDGHTTDRAGN